MKPTGVPGKLKPGPNKPTPSIRPGTPPTLPVPRKPPGPAPKLTSTPKGWGPRTGKVSPTTTTIARIMPNGQIATVSTGNGRVSAIHVGETTITHPLHGPRTVVTERNGLTIVSTGPHSSYVERPYFSRNGRKYYQRTYLVGGHTYARVYRGCEYRGVRYYDYVPVYYYHPNFYAWAYNSWAAPVYYGPAAWGWIGTPWFGVYGVYFTPYPVYRSASLWLTDYLIAATLQAAYRAGLDANTLAGQAYADGGAGQAPADNSGAPLSGGSAASNQTPLSPEVKQMIADEVQRQLATEQAAGANPQAAPSSAQVPDALNPAERVFVVASNLDVTAQASGCSLTPGDVVMRLSDAPDGNQNVTTSIQSSKQGDCATGQIVAIGVQDLQEMHNQFQEQLDSGLETLADKGGTGGLPKPPDTATRGGEVPMPTPDAGAAEQLQTQQQQANQIQAQVR